MYEIGALMQLLGFIIVSLQIFFCMKSGFSPIDFDVIFPIQSLEFMKSLIFGSNLKKKKLQKRNLKYFNFPPKY